MTFGIEVKNDDGKFVISEEAANLNYVGDATFVSSAVLAQMVSGVTSGNTVSYVLWQADFPPGSYKHTFRIAGTVETPIVFVKPVIGIPTAVLRVWYDTGYTYIMVATRGNNAPGRVLVFSNTILGPGGWGLRVYRSDGSICYDSTAGKIMLLRDVDLVAQSASSKFSLNAGAASGWNDSNYYEYSKRWYLGPNNVFPKTLLDTTSSVGNLAVAYMSLSCDNITASKYKYGESWIYDFGWRLYSYLLEEALDWAFFRGALTLTTAKEIQFAWLPADMGQLYRRTQYQSGIILGGGAQTSYIPSSGSSVSGGTPPSWRQTQFVPAPVLVVDASMYP